MELNIIIFIIIALSIAELAIQMTISTLSEWIKQLLWLSIEKRNTIIVLGTYKFWTKFLGKSLAVATIPIIIFFKIWLYISHMVECPYCICTWLALAVNIFYFKMTILTALIFAPFALVMVLLLDKIHTH